MGAVLTSTMTIVLLFTGPITPSDIDVIRPAVDEGSALAFFVTDEGKLPVDPAAKDWGLSKHPDATGMEFRVTDQTPEKSSSLVARITQAVGKLPEGHARIASVQGGGAGSRWGSNKQGESAPGITGGGMGSGSGSSPYGVVPSPRGTRSGGYSSGTMAFPGMPGRYGGMAGGPVVLEGDIQLTPEESQLWRELDERARQLAAKYKGEEPPLTRGGLPPGIPTYVLSERGPEMMGAPGTKEPQPTPTADEKAEIEEELTKVLNQMFDLKMTAYERKISGIEEDLRLLRSEIQERIKNKNLIVERRLNELTGKEDYLAW